MLKQINYKNKLHKKSLTEKDLNCRNDLINEVKFLQNSLRKKIEFEKDNYYQKFFKENKNNLIQVWKNIKSLVTFKSKAKHNNIKSLHIDKGKVTSDPIEICNHFNNHFTTIAGKIDKKIVKTGRNFNYYLITNSEKIFSIYPTTPTEVEDYIKNLDIRKSVGPFNIPNRVLKEFNKLFSIPISQIFNLSIEHGVFPQKMKIIIIVPIHKKDDTQDCNNYRPISLLPNISKLFEKLIKNRLSKFLEIK